MRPKIDKFDVLQQDVFLVFGIAFSEFDFHGEVMQDRWKVVVGFIQFIHSSKYYKI